MTLSPTETLRRCFATFTAEQRANVRGNLAAGVRPLCGEHAHEYVTDDGM